MSRLFSVVIVGRPNVGKSTLFNRLVGRRKALVHNRPGVTRDRNIEVVEHEGRAFQIVDTGGVLGESEDRLAGLVEEQVGLAMAGGDLVLHVVDGRDGLLPLDTDLARRIIKSGKRAALVVNKVDVAAHATRSTDFFGLGLTPVLALSAEHGGGVDDLWDLILKEAGGPEPIPEEGGPAPDEAVRVAIVGRPNVGKSSLLNRLLGESRSLVSEIPGTTRDPVDAELWHEGRKIVVVDTAGIRRKSKTERGAEMLSVILARRSLENCHIALLVVDASVPPSHQDAHIAGLVEEARRGAIVVLNKWDLIHGEADSKEADQAFADRLSFMEWMPRLRVSAQTGRHVDRVLPAVLKAYDNFARTLPTATLNKALQDMAARVSPPSIQGKELKLRYATQTGAAPPIITVFTNSKLPPPESYSRYLKNRFREFYDLEGSPFILKFRRE